VKTILSPILVAVAAAIITGCVAPAASAQQSSVLDTVLSTKILRVATVTGNPPWESLGPDGQPQGYDIDIAKAIASTLSAQIQWVITDSPGRVTSLQTGKADLALANFTETPTRALSVTFSIPYVIVKGQYMGLATTPLNTIADMNNAHAKVANVRGGTLKQETEAACPNCQVLDFTAIADTLQAVNAGQADVASNDTLFNGGAMAQNPGKYKVIQGYLSAEPECIGLPSGDFKWTQFINTWVQDFNLSGANNAAFKKWFGFNLPQ